ncbi:hypothetical protein SIN8267_02233 [Sinobacterium norvegicum]|uniref:Thiolase C-terminal domain-containing protein n=1 Tax=Sinobacterium norvegicum TaxID=1641715 RepID=A0ABN8EIC4_9GAMM|nr:hypothetical protein [Sinobacterium norvegicum]CAH0992117.1 hypothetical protein SIN8267_02233 [Sinobacterium norvegicum]
MNDRTPVLIGAGQFVQRQTTDDSPMTLAAQASMQALTHALSGTACDTAQIAQHIDTIAVTRLFSDMGHLWPCEWGRSNNPPQSIAQAIGATPKHRIYSSMGGNQPQSMLIEFAADIARGDRDMVLIAGAEALKNQRHGARQKKLTPTFSLDWSEEFSQPLEDRGIGESIATTQEQANGLTSVALYYALIEQAQRQQAGRSIPAHQKAMAQLLASFSAVAANNAYAQFPGQQTAEEIISAAPLNHLYSKRMIAQDSVNQSAAVILCSVAKARELGVPESHFIYLQAMAEGAEHTLTQRPDPALSPIANHVTDRVLDTAGLTAEQIELIDIYSCFPCAITAVANHMGLPVDGSRALTLTGGLPYFGGPGNNYSLHAMAEVVTQLRQNTAAAKPVPSYAMVTANGGVLSKHASVIYSNRANDIDWANTETWVRNTDKPMTISDAPTAGRIVSYVIYPTAKGSIRAIIIGRTNEQQHFVASTSDPKTLTAMSASDPSGQAVDIIIKGEQLKFVLTTP